MMEDKTVGDEKKKMEEIKKEQKIDKMEEE